MTHQELAAEVAKVNGSQRSALRRAIGEGSLEFLNVSTIGHKTRVAAKMYGVNHIVDLGPRGKILARAAF